MKDFKGTKEKWILSHNGYYYEIGNERGQHFVSIIENRYIGIGKREQKANGQLIAAAPDLLEALQNLMEGVHNLPPLTAIAGLLEKEYKQAEQAINKALGI